MKKLVLLIVAVLSCLNFVYGYDFEYGGLGYTILSKEDKTVSVSYGNNQSGDLVIPRRVSNNTKVYVVTEIGPSAFAYCSYITSVFIPSSVTKMGDCAFYGCSGLTKVNISDLSAWCKIDFESGSNPLYFAEHLYLNNEEIKDLVIPEGVTEIGSYAFECCKAVASVSIPSSVTKMGDCAFWGFSGLTKVNISDLSAWCKIDFESCSNPLYYAKHLYLNNEEIKDLVIPEDMTEIGDYAFEGCKGLTSVTIPSSVTEIGSSAFSGCTGLTSVTIPSSVTKIDGWAFYRCTGLTSVTIPSSVTEIGSDAFSGCTGLTSVSIPSSVTEIGSYAFYYCTGLTSVTIPASVTEIGSYAFEGCSGLTSVSCLWDEPVSTYENIFSDDTYNCPLYVPIGTLEKYDNTVPWYRFSKKIEKDFTGVDSPIVDAETTYSISGNTLHIVGDAPVRVVAINGSVVYSGSGNCDIDLNKGLYVVVIGGKASKVAVR